jgi:hypothetical protein
MVNAELIPGQDRIKLSFGRRGHVPTLIIISISDALKLIGKTSEEVRNALYPKDSQIPCVYELQSDDDRRTHQCNFKPGYVKNTYCPDAYFLCNGYKPMEVQDEKSDA